MLPMRKKGFLAAVLCLCLFLNTGSYALAVQSNEDTVSGNNIAGGWDESYPEDADEAGEKLEALAREKEIYALVYLTDTYEVKADAAGSAKTVAVLPTAWTVQILGMKVEVYNQEEDLFRVWYRVQFYQQDELLSGYIEEAYLAYSDERLLEWKQQYPSLFPENNVSLLSTTTYYSDVERFPSSYQVYLKKLKETHPNWIFVPMNVNRDWEECVREQLGNYSWIYYTQPERFRGEKINSSWYYASYEGISYYMDPRNFLTEENIFQFEQNTYNASYHTQAALQNFLNGTFMAGTIPGDSLGRTYAYTIWTSGKDRGLSPFNLAARVIQEQGVKGTSAMISGTYPGYEGYYNYYNISASGTTDAEVLKNGLTYARNQGWNTRYKSLYEGAAFIGNSYILKGQDTLYLQKFDVEKSRGYLHQYMQNIMAPYTEGRSMRSMYVSAGSINSAFVFKIPVFKNMPGANYTLTPASLTLEKGKSSSLSLKCNGILVSDPQSVAVFSSGNPTVAQVSQTGVVTAKGSGETVIRARIQNGDEEVELTVQVKVLAALKGISLDQSEIQLYVKEDLTEQVAFLDEEGRTQYLDGKDCPGEAALQVIYDPWDTTDERTVRWTVEDENILTLELDSQDGSRVVLYAKAGGTTTVTAQVGKFTASVQVKVRVPMSSAEVTTTKLSLYRGQSRQLMVKYSPFTTTDIVEPEWYSDNEDIVVVKNGVIYAVGEGSTKIHGAVGPFDGSQAKLSCEVSVEACQVVFKNKNGTDWVTAKGDYGKSLEYLSSETGEIPWLPESEGEIFMGWYTGENGQGDEITSSTTLYDHLTVYPYFVSREQEFYVKPIGNLMYTGASLKPEPEVYSGSSKLVKGVDYTVSYENNKDVSTDKDTVNLPTVRIKGKGKYTQTITVTFNILPKNISHQDIKTQDLTTAYTGRLQKMQPELWDGERSLQWNKDYLLEYPDTSQGAYLEAGTYEITITGKGNYTGVRTVYLTISKRIQLSQVTVGKINSMSYAQGEECIPELSLSYQGKALEKNKDYTAVFSNNRQVGTASVLLTGKGDYIGSRTLTFEITGCKISTLSFSGIEDREYTGEALELKELKITDKAGNVLVEDTDYQVTYKNNQESGLASVIIKGQGGYEGSVTKTFRILPYDIAANSQSWNLEGIDGGLKPAFAAALEKLEVVYEKDGVKPEPTVTFKGTILVKGKDYQLFWKNNTQAGSAGGENPPTLVITGKGNYTGTVTMAFTILTKDIERVAISASDVKYKNRTGYCFVSPVLKDESGRKLVSGKDYSSELSYTYETQVTLQDGTVRKAGDIVEKTDIPTPGENQEAKIRVTVRGIGNYSGSTHTVYSILENTSWLSELLPIFQEKAKEPESSPALAVPVLLSGSSGESVVKITKEATQPLSALQNQVYSTKEEKVDEQPDYLIGTTAEELLYGKKPETESSIYYSGVGMLMGVLNP